MTEKKYVVIVRIRGLTQIKSTIKDTLSMLNLDKKHSMIIREATPSIMGMVKKAKDYITYGVIDSDTLTKSLKGYNTSEQYHLHPPRGGFERKGIKRDFTIGGALGNRGEKIVELVEKMKKE